ncbi:MAG: ATP-binding protein, partial [Erysipelotrichaceae bacterium]|nr:ATP-binding protein [Erysipelotrichaceae bacterium]
ELYGEQRLLNILNARSYKNAEEICQAVKEDVDKFAGEADQFDDITMLCFRYLGDSGVPTIRFDETKLEDIPEITEFVESELEKMGCPVKTVYQMNIAVDEICSNIIKYAYPKKPGSLTVTMFEKKYPHTLAIRFEDEGIPYNPLTKEDPDVTLSAEERQIGGLGIFMVRKMMDDVRYKYENDRNILTIYKKLDE